MCSNVLECRRRLEKAGRVEKVERKLERKAEVHFVAVGLVRVLAKSDGALLAPDVAMFQEVYTPRPLTKKLARWTPKGTR